jgi:hypothetical protein
MLRPLSRTLSFPPKIERAHQFAFPVLVGFLQSQPGPFLAARHRPRDGICDPRFANATARLRWHSEWEKRGVVHHAVKAVWVWIVQGVKTGVMNHALPAGSFCSGDAVDHADRSRPQRPMNTAAITGSA